MVGRVEECVLYSVAVILGRPCLHIAGVGG